MRSWFVVFVALSLMVSCGPKEHVVPEFGPAQVTVAKPLKKAVVEWDRYTGRLTAVESVEVRARVSGYLRTIHFLEGKPVEKGDLLFVIDRKPFEAELAKSEASLQEAKARLVRSQALVVQAEAMNSQALSQRDLAQKRLDRANKAMKTNAIAAEQVDERESELDQAKAALEAAKAAIASAKADTQTSRAAILTAEANVERSQLDLDYTRIKAPITGRIGVRRVTKGNWIDGGNSGATLLTSIVTVDPIHITFDANEQAFLKYVRLNRSGKRASSREVKNPVFAALIDEEGYPHQGHMDFVDNQIDPNTGTIRGRAIFRNKDQTLTPGLFATVQIPGSGRYEALMVPDAAVGANQAQRYVMVVGADNTVTPRPVVLGPMNDGLRIIRSGLDGSEDVVIRGLQRIRPGAEVSPKTEVLKLDEMSDGLPDDFLPLSESEWIRRDAQVIDVEEGR